MAAIGQVVTTNERLPSRQQGSVLLLVSEEPGPQLLDELRARGLTAESELLVVAPALASRLGLWTDEESWHQRAEAVAEATAARLTAAGFSTRAWVGDPDPVDALDDALRREQVAEVLVIDAVPASAAWLGHDLAARVRERVNLPVTVISAGDTQPIAAARHAGRIVLVAMLGVVVALVLALVGVGRAWLVGELAVVLGVVILDVAAHAAVLGGALWLALGRHSRPHASR